MKRNIYLNNIFDFFTLVREKWITLISFPLIRPTKIHLHFNGFKVRAVEDIIITQRPAE